MSLSQVRLELELARWRAAGRRARLWWRDDDARRSTAALDRLLQMAQARATPVTLAVIPDQQPADLASCLRGVAEATVVQHGVDHQNRRPGAAAGEFAHDWSRLRVATQLRMGWNQLSTLPGAFHAYVPPWNDVHPALTAALEDCGYEAWSAWGEPLARGETEPGVRPSEGPVRIDAHLDLLRWKKGVRFRGADRLRDALRTAMAERRRLDAWDAPIGLLTHHLDHDEAAWAFLDSFLVETQRDAVFEWRALPELVASVAGGSAERGYENLRRAAKPGS